MSPFVHRLVLAGLLLASGCSGRAVLEPVPVWQPPRVPPGQAVAPVRLRSVALGPPAPSAAIGSIAATGCAGPFGPVPAAAAAEAVAFSTIAPVFASVMHATGLPIAGDGPGDLRVDAQIRRVAVDLCRPGPFGPAAPHRVSGEAALRICWTVVSPAHGGAVYAVETRGSGREDQALPYGLDALLRQAFAAAATNLAADRGFREILRAAGAPSRLFAGRPPPLPVGPGPGCPAIIPSSWPAPPPSGVDPDPAPPKIAAQ